MRWSREMRENKLLNFRARLDWGLYAYMCTPKPCKIPTQLAKQSKAWSPREKRTGLLLLTHFARGKREEGEERSI